MSLQMGLGACEEDLEVQGEIDFDFFEGNQKVDFRSPENDKTRKGNAVREISECTVSESQLNKTPTIVTTCPQESGAVNKVVCIETVIPSPEDYYCKESCSSSCTENLKRGVNLSFLNTSESHNGINDPLNSPLSSSSTSESDIYSSSLTLSDEDSFEETDSMTDVSPLPSHCQSPMAPKSEDNFENDTCMTEKMLLHNKSDDVNDSTSMCNKKSVLHKSVKVNQLVKAMKQLEVDHSTNRRKSKFSESIPFAMGANKQKKNPSFSNEEVRKIDLDNQCLLKKILAQQNRTKPNFHSVNVRPSSSINRQRQQRQIELENMALLQRLEATKPSKELARSHLLHDFKQRPSVSTSSRASVRPVSTSLPIPSSCRNSAYSSGRSSTLTVPLCSKISKQK